MRGGKRPHLVKEYLRRREVGPIQVTAEKKKKPFLSLPYWAVAALVGGVALVFV
jgi:hypothetical protein